MATGNETEGSPFYPKEVRHLGPRMCFRTERFYIRPLRPSDATERYIKWFNDPELQMTMGKNVRGWDKKKAAAHIARFDNVKTCHMGFFPLGEALPVGFSTVEFRKNDIVHTVMVLGEPEYRNLGVALEYAWGTLDWTFGDMGQNKAIAFANSRNLPAIVASEKVGMTLDGRLREHYKEQDGTRSDELHYSLLRSDWEKMVEKGLPEYE